MRGRGWKQSHHATSHGLARGTATEVDLAIAATLLFAAWKRRGRPGGTHSSQSKFSLKCVAPESDMSIGWALEVRGDLQGAFAGAGPALSALLGDVVPSARGTVHDRASTRLV